MQLAKSINQNTTDSSRRCNFDQLSDDGISKNNSFALRSVLPALRIKKEEVHVLRSPLLGL